MDFAAKCEIAIGNWRLTPRYVWKYLGTGWERSSRKKCTSPQRFLLFPHRLDRDTYCLVEKRENTAVDSRLCHSVGVGQLSLVEHALCPLDSARSLRGRFLHECQYKYTDTAGRRRTAHVRVACPLGLSAQDESYLWGLLALTFSQPKPNPEFHATPHYCLRQLGVIDQHARRGGRQYRDFAAALERLSAVRYQNQAFYDPVRREHRRVSFGLFDYSLPLARDSSRAWRIVWDTLLFELVSAVGGRLAFDLEMYRELDPASRRLFLLLTKMFRRRLRSPAFELRDLGVQVLGFASTLAARDLKVKVGRAIGRLAEQEIVASDDPRTAFGKKANGSIVVRLNRGAYFNKGRRNVAVAKMVESPLVEPLRAIGVDERAIPRLLRRHATRLIQEWVDITLAAQERFGREFFRKSPAAFFVDNLQNAAAGQRTPPDWWRELQRAERCDRKRQKKRGKTDGSSSREDNGRLTDQLAEAMRVQLEAAGQTSQAACRNAEQFAEQYCGSVDPAGGQIMRLLQLLR